MREYGQKPLQFNWFHAALPHSRCDCTKLGLK